MTRLAVTVALAGCSFHTPSLASGDAPAGAIDAPIAPSDVAADTAPLAPEFVIEAESPSSSTMPAAHQWMVETDITGYSGASFMQCMPNDGGPCADSTKLATCAASLVYRIDVVTAGRYYLQVRMLAQTTADDSIWYGIDGVPDPTPIDHLEDGTWRWDTGDSFALTAGPHTLHIWQREGGARVDVVALTPTMSPP